MGAARIAMEERLVAGLNVAIGGRADGPAIVLVHGLGATWQVWRPLLDQLGLSFRLVAVDLPGFGRSAALADGSFELDEVSELVGDVIRELGLEQVLLAGHSLGGGVAAYLAAEHPNLVERLVLIAPAGFRQIRLVGGAVRMIGGSDRVSSAIRRLSLVSLPAVAFSSRARKVIFRGLFHDHSALEPAHAVELVRGWSTAAAFTVAVSTIVRGEVAHRMDEITMPTLLLWGDRDRVVDPWPARQLARALPNAQLRMLANTGHMAMAERPAQVCAAIERFAGTPARDRAADIRASG